MPRVDGRSALALAGLALAAVAVSPSAPLYDFFEDWEGVVKESKDDVRSATVARGRTAVLVGESLSDL